MAAPFRRASVDPRIVPTRPVELDPSHPLTTALAACYLPGVSFNDLAARNSAMYFYNGGGCVFTGTASGPAIALDGTGYLNASSPALNFTASDFTLSILIKFSDLSNSPVIIWRGNYQDRGYYAQISSDGTTTLTLNSSGVNQANSTASGAVATGRFHWLTFTRIGSVVRLYVNGVDQTATSTAVSNPADAVGTLLELGHYEGGSGYSAPETIGAFMAWSRGLNAKEVARLNAEPFAMLRPVARRQYFTAAATPGGAVAGTASATGSASAVLSGGGALTGIAGASATASAMPGGAGPLSGIATAAATATAALSSVTTLAGTATVTGTATAVLTGRGSVSGATAGATAATAVTGGAGALSGSASASATASGALSAMASGALSGTANATAAASATLAGTGALAGIATASAAATGTARGAGALSGTAGAVSSAAAILTGAASGALAGTANASAAATGTLAGQGAASGVATTTGMASGVLAGTGALAGASVASALAQGVLTGFNAGQIAGQAVAVAHASGTLSGRGALAGLAAGQASASYRPAIPPSPLRTIAGVAASRTVVGTGSPSRNL